MVQKKFGILLFTLYFLINTQTSSPGERFLYTHLRCRTSGGAILDFIHLKLEEIKIIKLDQNVLRRNFMRMEKALSLDTGSFFLNNICCLLEFPQRRRLVNKKAGLEFKYLNQSKPETAWDFISDYMFQKVIFKSTFPSEGFYLQRNHFYFQLE